MEQIISIERMPIIKQQFLFAKEQVTARTAPLKDLVITEESRQETKKLRAALRKEKEEYEAQFKAVKNELNKPLKEIESLYRECIKEPYESADEALAKGIYEIEDGLKAETEKKIRDWFEEYKISLGLDFLRFEQTRIRVTLSASCKGLKEKAKAFCDKVSSELESIMSMEGSEEISAEYRQNGFDLPLAIKTVNDRYKRIEAEKERLARLEEQKNQKDAAAKKALAAAEKSSVAVPAPVEMKSAENKSEGAEIKSDNDIITLTFTVTATRAKLRGLRAYLEREEIIYD